MIYERRHSREIADFGGLWTQMPLYSRLFLITVLASVGLPGLCGFVGEFLILAGVARHSMALAALAGVGVILAACYLLSMFQRAFYGEVTDPHVREMPDINGRELWCIVPLVVLMCWFGLYPNRFLAPAEPAMSYIQQRLHEAEPVAVPLDTAEVTPAAPAADALEAPIVLPKKARPKRGAPASAGHPPASAAPSNAAGQGAPK
jgi:NADH-quinone oxidoreductase subunit M